MEKMFRFWHERLDVYRVGLEFVAWVEAIDRHWFRGYPDRSRQLRRAADSIVLNIAEGSSQTSGKARANFYRIAAGSAGECHAVLEILGLGQRPVGDGLRLVARIGAMLSRMGAQRDR